ncbi:MAG: polymorphic toxin type 17 domain-containing protein [Gemmataceae bacterium]
MPSEHRQEVPTARHSMWPKKYPWNLLPGGGRRPFVPPKRGDWLTNPPRGPQNGYVDADGNEWVPHPNPNNPDDFHWDVQHPDGSHTNVGADGEIHHGADNFP